jgi:hypothetical protein
MSIAIIGVTRVLSSRGFKNPWTENDMQQRVNTNDTIAARANRPKR